MSLRTSIRDARKIILCTLSLFILCNFFVRVPLAGAESTSTQSPPDRTTQPKRRTLFEPYNLLTTSPYFPERDVSTLTRPVIPEELKFFPWQTGMVIGISEMRYDPKSIFIEASTASAVTHVGVVYALGKNQVKVIHADRFHAGLIVQSVEEFIYRSTDAQGKPNYVILEPHAPLTSEQKHKFLMSYLSLLDSGVSYNSSHIYDPTNRWLDCAQFVHVLFKMAGMLAPGFIENVGDATNMEAFSGVLLRMFNGSVPDLNNEPKPRAPASFERVMTPYSVVMSPHLRVVHTTLPLNRLSDKQIFERWDKQGGFEALVGLKTSGSDTAVRPSNFKRWVGDPFLDPPIEYYESARLDPDTTNHHHRGAEMVKKMLNRAGPLEHRVMPAPLMFTRYDDMREIACRGLFFNHSSPATSQDINDNPFDDIHIIEALPPLKYFDENFGIYSGEN